MNLFDWVIARYVVEVQAPRKNMGQSERTSTENSQV